ncbi:MAG: hypothetical protein HY744_09700 [Deltaproteobacteria bacterium]|nr:hypothetical protein [Deltaproteobacteria bacterium]
MPRTAEDIETLLYRLGRPFERTGQTFVVSSGADRPPIALHVADPVLLARVAIGPLPADEKRQLALLRQMLVYNATDLVHAAYGIDGEQMVLAAGLALENIDENEIDAALSDIDLALVRHTARLSELARGV